MKTGETGTNGLNIKLLLMICFRKQAPQLFNGLLWNQIISDIPEY